MSSTAAGSTHNRSATITITVLKGKLDDDENCTELTSLNFNEPEVQAEGVKTVKLGRSENSTDDLFITISHDAVSQLHCELNFRCQTSVEVASASFEVVDKSRNGVLVRGQRVTKNVPFSVKFGERILIAKRSIDDCVWLKIARNVPILATETVAIDIDETQNYDLSPNQESNENRQSLTSDTLSIANCSPTNEATLSIQTTATIQIQNSGDSNSTYQSVPTHVSSDRETNLQPTTVTQAHSSSATEISKAANVSNVQKRPSDHFESQDDQPCCSKSLKVVDEKSADSEKASKVNSRAESPEPSENQFGCELKCSICTEIFHQPVSLQPCMHTFCGGCYSSWMMKSNRCPSCRRTVEKISKNRLVLNLCESYLQAHPEERRSEDDLKQIDSMNKLTKDIMTQPDVTASSFDFEFSGSDDEDDRISDGSDNESESESSQPTTSILLFDSRPRFNVNRITAITSAPSLPVITCIQCPSMQSGLSIPESMRMYTCPAVNARHLTCQCCARFMPDRRTRITISLHGVLTQTDNPQGTSHGDGASTSSSSVNTSPDWLKQMCFKCSKPFCRLYFGSCDSRNTSRPGCLTCIDYFKSYRFTEHEYNAMINGNRYESLILLDYLRSKEISLSNFFTDHILTQLPFVENEADSSLTSPAPLEQDTILCRTCAIRTAGLLCYEFRKQIPNDDLPRTVTNRPDCWYGRNCMTQRTRDHHANNFNHICDQSR